MQQLGLRPRSVEAVVFAQRLLHFLRVRQIALLVYAELARSLPFGMGPIVDAVLDDEFGCCLGDFGADLAIPPGTKAAIASGNRMGTFGHGVTWMAPSGHQNSWL